MYDMPNKREREREITKKTLSKNKRKLTWHVTDLLRTCCCVIYYGCLFLLKHTVHTEDVRVWCFHPQPQCSHWFIATGVQVKGQVYFFFFILCKTDSEFRLCLCLGCKPRRLKLSFRRRESKIRINNRTCVLIRLIWWQCSLKTKW